MYLRTSSRNIRAFPSFRPSPSISIRYVSNKENEPGRLHDPNYESRQGGKAAASQPASDPQQPIDSASHSKGGKSAGNKGTEGNPAGVGMVDQVGGEGEQGASTVGGKEEARAPGLFESLKAGLGIGTSSEDVKQNQGGGKGVTGTGSPQ